MNDCKRRLARIRPEFMLPHFIQPCSPIPANSVPVGEGWLHELKLDGYRLQVAKDGPEVRLYSRRGHDWGKRLAALAEALQAIPARCILVETVRVKNDSSHLHAWT